MSKLEHIQYNENGTIAYIERYNSTSYIKFDSQGNVLEYIPPDEDDDMITREEELNEPDDVFYKLYPCEKRNQDNKGETR